MHEAKAVVAHQREFTGTVGTVPVKATIDGAIQGFGGCPMASDNMIGNMPTEKIITFCEEKGIESGINPLKFEVAYNYASDIFLNYK